MKLDLRDALLLGGVILVAVLLVVAVILHFSGSGGGARVCVPAESGFRLATLVSG